MHDLGSLALNDAITRHAGVAKSAATASSVLNDANQKLLIVLLDSL
jgi:exonuclease VII small subunit